MGLFAKAIFSKSVGNCLEHITKKLDAKGAKNIMKIVITFVALCVACGGMV